MKKVTDYLGNEVKVGSRVITVGCSSNSGHFFKGTVTKIEQTNYSCSIYIDTDKNRKTRKSPNRVIVI